MCHDVIKCLSVSCKCLSHVSAMSRYYFWVCTRCVCVCVCVLVCVCVKVLHACVCTREMLKHSKASERMLLLY